MGLGNIGVGVPELPNRELQAERLKARMKVRYRMSHLLLIGGRILNEIRKILLRNKVLKYIVRIIPTKPLTASQSIGNMRE